MLSKLKKIDDNFKKAEQERNNEKELKELKKLQEKYNLNDLDPDDLETLKTIANNMTGLGLMKTGVTLTGTKAEERLKIGYLATLVEQNWLIINQLSRILNKLDE